MTSWLPARPFSGRLSLRVSHRTQHSHNRRSWIFHQSSFTTISLGSNLTCRSSSIQRQFVSHIFPTFCGRWISTFLVETRMYLRLILWCSYRDVAWLIPSQTLLGTITYGRMNNIQCRRKAWNLEANHGVKGDARVARAQWNRPAYNYLSISDARCHSLSCMRDVIMVPLLKWYLTLWLRP